MACASICIPILLRSWFFLSINFFSKEKFAERKVFNFFVYLFLKWNIMYLKVLLFNGYIIYYVLCIFQTDLITAHSIVMKVLDNYSLLLSDALSDAFFVNQKYHNEVSVDYPTQRNHQHSNDVDIHAQVPKTFWYK